MDNNKENSTYAPVPIIEDKVDKNIMKTPLSSDDSLARSDVEDGQPSPSPRRNRKTDPFYFICKRFGFPMLGNNYILRTTDDGDPRMTVGPHWSGTVFTTVIILSGTYFLAPLVWGRPAALAATAFFFGCSTASLWLVACTDPGIVRRATAPAAAAAAADGLRFCDKCSIYQPEGAVHCNDCGVCIEGHDHHCPWMGKCLGRGNICYFWLFNASWFFYLLFLFYIIIAA
uniref:Palmitoyltransferase n=1 Tax=Heterosigma akashiwo TaxID=2829 RepID=A0A6V1ME69_HETAK|mmetsp:Transcript_10081/g.14116  ORF Transcript_10081/g.14116 Transcript_10081/m.14116 type:complete len:229 (+) Transcript_10081:46-732(+)